VRCLTTDKSIKLLAQLGLRDINCHMGWHCYLLSNTHDAPHLNSSQTNQYWIYQNGWNIWVDLGGWFCPNDLNIKPLSHLSSAVFNWLTMIVCWGLCLWWQIYELFPCHWMHTGMPSLHWTLCYNNNNNSDTTTTSLQHYDNTITLLLQQYYYYYTTTAYIYMNSSFVTRCWNLCKKPHIFTKPN